MNLVQKAKLNVIKKHWIQVGEERERARIHQMSTFPIEAYRQGMLEERERIIKALEDEGERYYISQEVFDYVVSIIRGEDNV
jgi:hypothetical protein